MLAADKPVVTNTTPVVGLAVLDRLHLLRDLCGEVLIPAAVREELAAGGDRPGSLIDLGKAPWIRTVALKVPQSAVFFSDLDRGESEVIALALEVDARMVDQLQANGFRVSPELRAASLRMAGEE